MQGAPAGATTSVPEPDSGIACLVMILAMFERPADAGQIRHQFGAPGRLFEAEDIVRTARRLELKARTVDRAARKLAELPKPVIAEMSNGRFVVVGGANQDKVLIHDPGASRPQVVVRQAFDDAWSGRVVMLARRAKPFGAGSRFDIRWFVPAVVKYRHLLSEVVVASFFLNCFGLVTPLFFQVIIDKVLVHHGMTTLDVLIFGLVVISLFESMMGGLRTYIFSHTTNRIDVELGAKLFDHLLGLPIAYFESRQAGQSVARVRELENIRNFITGSGLTLVVDLFFTVVFFVVMWYFSPILTLIALGSIPFYVGVAAFVTPIFRRRLDEKFERGAASQSFLVESVTGIETLKALAVEPQAQRLWEEQLAAYVSASFKATNLGNIAGQSIRAISKITMAITIYVGAQHVIAGDLSVGQLVAFNMLLGRVTSPILRISRLWNDFQQARLSVDRLGDILNTPTEPRYNPNRATLTRIDGSIRLEGVTFRYRPDMPEVLRRVSLNIPAGQVLGIVGPSGSGKSTLTKLVQRMYVPESGRVLVDGVDLAMVDTAWLRRQIGVVLQENVLFNRSVRENIALADPGLPMERVVAAAKLAGAHEFIMELAEGYDTLVGERGATLSGGQRQRIAIARALITDPRILILDEATSALDYESERIIQENMRAICQGRTVIIIAHRLSTVRRADRIVTIVGGEMVEDGDHDELMRRNGPYAGLHRLQSGEILDAAE